MAHVVLAILSESLPYTPMLVISAILGAKKFSHIFISLHKKLGEI